ncbi:methyltransferase family protein [Chitinophaga niastensis]|uniref:Methyltransferase family protein n=1 Tax=Chitinophaga niastensis TaxID=536980 RepID=A0A2P8HRW3_CHINA|nr:class I SAM-dependent methyltransferase [Chitinophaga niastensis]PSL48924.1 methyltransferase family protein [Chitinophaga niastensis]
MNKNLYSKEDSKQFYEERFTQGYMDDWDINKKRRVFEILRELDLPEKGRLLDFGCGNGVFTEVLKKALPHWEVYGCDISEVAISHAQNRFPDCTFFVSDNDRGNSLNEKFDFIFSHHVLEHVFDIEKTMAEINDFLKTGAAALLIFPCGNEGSFEHHLSLLRSDGINEAMGNRFFFEDPGHVRRLTSSQTAELMNQHNFQLSKAYYGNHYHGAIKWISQSSPKFVWSFTDAAKAKNKAARKEINRLRNKLLLLNFIQLPAIIFNKVKNKRAKNLKHYALLLIDFIPSLFSYPFYAAVNRRSEQEWKEKKKHPHGSEMYLFFKREN